MANYKINKQMLKALMAIGSFSAGLLSYPFLVKVIPEINYLNQININPVPTTPPTTNTKSDSDIADLNVCFTPNQSCLPQILKDIDNAQSSILLLGYSFTSQPLAAALIKAKRRGVIVRIVLDQGQKNQKSSQEAIKTLLTEQIKVHLDYSVKIAHNKVIIIDDSKIITGSYNWTGSAEFSNAENLIFIKSRTLAKKYNDYFEERWNISKPYTTEVQPTSEKTRVKRKKVYPKHASAS